MSLVSDNERDRAAASLRQQFVHGRLSAEQLAERIELALRAHDRRDFQRAFRGLPPLWRDGDEMRRLALQAKRTALRAFAAALWVFVTLVLVISFAVGLAIHGFALRTAIAYAVIWLGATALARNLRHRA